MRRPSPASLSDRQPIYSLQLPPDDEFGNEFTFEQLAERLIRDLRHQNPHGPYRLCGSSFGAALAYLVVFVSVLAYLLWFHLLTVSGATAASSYHFMMPPLGMLFGWLLLGEHVAPTDLVGIVPVALGIYLVTRPTNSQSKTTSA